MKAELILKFEFEASHSLSGYEVPHPHFWRLEVVVGGIPQQNWMEGRIIDIVELRTQIEKRVNPLRLSYLNDNPHVSAEVRKFPTCETLSQFFCDELQQVLTTDFIETHPSVCLNSVMIAICDMDRVEMGAVRVRF